MIRIVKLTFKPEHVDDFLNHFETVKNDINSFPGCQGMQLLRDKKNTNVFFTYSEWTAPEDLESYRTSALFGGIWPVVKKWFDAKAEAWSVDKQFDGFDRNV